MEPSLHSAERRERRGKWFPALVLLLIGGLLLSTWVGFFAFLGANPAASLVEEFEDRFVPPVGPDDIGQFPNLSQLSELWSADNVQLAELSLRLSDPVPIREIPPHVLNAIVAAEDGDFYEHRGVDFESIVRAGVANLRSDTIQGGSTITQQVVRNQSYVGREQTILRKIAEARYAAELEKIYSKDQILEFYVNSVYFGWNAYGIRAASREYFGKELDELLVDEAAALSTTIRNPSLYDPRLRPGLVEERRNNVLDSMVGDGFLTREEADAAMARPLVTIPHETFLEPAPQVRIAVVNQLLNDPEFAVLGATPEQRSIAIFGCPAEDTQCEEEPGLKGGLKITTTVDFHFQTRANQILRRWLPIPPDGTKAPTGAITTVDTRTGAVRVMAGGLEFGSDFEAGERDYNLATEGQRQPGSSFKPFALVAYLEQGGSLNSQWNGSSPQELECEFPCGPGGELIWKVRGGSDGIRSLYRATYSSTNTVYAQVALEVGPAAIKEVAQRMGITADLPEVYSLALGAGEVSPLDMASAYSTFATYGKATEPYLVERIEDAEGNVLYQHRSDSKQVLAEPLAAAVVETLQQVVARGTGTRANIDRPQAGKTGTNQDFRDAWFVGFVPQYATAVWVGYADEQISMRNLTINGESYSRVFGGDVPAPIWREFMSEFLADVPIEEFPPQPPESSRYKVVPSTEVPDVVGLMEDEAKQEIWTAHLDVFVEPVDSLEEKGVVLEQVPDPESMMTHGAAMTIKVSTGVAPWVVLPDLIGKTFPEAVKIMSDIAAATEIEVKLQPIFQVTQPELWNQIIVTSPGFGAQVNAIEPVIVIIGRAPVENPNNGG